MSKYPDEKTRRRIDSAIGYTDRALAAMRRQREREEGAVERWIEDSDKEQKA
jgi:hypothetical protein